MASNFSVNINEVTSTAINYTVNFTPEEKNYTAGYVSVSGDQRVEETYNLEVQLSEHSPSTFVPMANGEYIYGYERPSSENYSLGNLFWTFSAILTVEKSIYTGRWGAESTSGQWYNYIPNTGTFYEPTYSNYPHTRITVQIAGSRPITDSTTGTITGYMYYITTSTSYAEEYLNSTETQVFPIEKNIFPRPAEFTFINCSSGNQWELDKGINSLITNIEEFSDYATQWKAWKEQYTASICPQFDSPISAGQLNNIYIYVGSTSRYKTGDQVSAAMFNNLASIINSG